MGESGKEILQVSIAVFSGAVEIFSGKDGSAPSLEKIVPYAYGCDRCYCHCCCGSSCYIIAAWAYPRDASPLDFRQGWTPMQMSPHLWAQNITQASCTISELYVSNFASELECLMQLYSIHHTGLPQHKVANNNKNYTEYKLVSNYMYVFIHQTW